MWLWSQILDFFCIRGLLSLVYDSPRPIGIMGWAELFVPPIFPFLLILEFCVILTREGVKQIRIAYKIPFYMYFANTLLSGTIALGLLSATQNFFSMSAPFVVETQIWGVVYTYLVWEFSHYVYHFTSHKVRLLWCFHSPHHAPAHMNLSVLHSGFPLQGAYAIFVRTGICTLLGVSAPLLAFAMVVDGCWGALIHVSETVWPDGSIRGFLGSILISPIHHRIHHSRNSEYTDKNYCNTLSVWDRFFGTFQSEIPGIKPIYGIQRNVDYDSFLDIYLGELKSLCRDVAGAKTLKDKILLFIMPPGWAP